MRAHVRTVVVVALAVGLMALFLRQAHLAAVWAEIVQGRWLLLACAVGTTLTTYLLRAVRWQCMLQSLGSPRLSTAFRMTVIGFAASFLLPARAGEFLRPYLLARREGFSAAAAFATILLERLLDMITVLVLLAVYLLWFGTEAAAADSGMLYAIQAGGLGLAAASVVVLALMFLLAGHPAALADLAARLGRVMPERLAHLLERVLRLFGDGFTVLRRPRQLLATLLWSLPLWLSIAAGIWLVSQAFHIVIGFADAFLLMAILVVGVAVPTPGAVGGFHEAFRLAATTFFHVPNDRAVGAALVLHAISFVPVTLLGIVFMAQEGLSLGRARSLAGLARQEEDLP